LNTLAKIAGRNCLAELALARLKATLGFVDDIDPALTTNDTAITMPVLQRFQRILNFHNGLLSLKIFVGTSDAARPYVLGSRLSTT
jgi:hypothetical protein